MHSAASMGPRFFKRGDTAEEFDRMLAIAPLQWGHASLSVETQRGCFLFHVRTIRFNGATLL